MLWEKKDITRVAVYWFPKFDHVKIFTVPNELFINELSIK